MNKVIFIGDRYQTLRTELDIYTGIKDKTVRVKMSIFDEKGVKFVTLTNKDAENFIKFFKSIELD